MSVEEQDDTLYWQDKSAGAELVEVPAYVVASYDNFIHSRGAFDAYRRIASTAKWLRVHDTHEWQDFYDPRWTAELAQFFDHYPKGEANGWTDTPPVRIVVLDPSGTDEIGRVVEAWPPAIFRLAVDHETELIGYIKLKLWVEVDGRDDVDLIVIVEKVDADGRPIPRDESTGRVIPLQTLGYQRASRRALDPARSTEVEPFLLLQGEQRRSAGEVVPLEINVWPTGLKIHAGEMLQVTVAPYKAASSPFEFGSARITIPVDGFTFDPDRPGSLQTLGGHIDASPAWSREQTVGDVPRNAGDCVVHMGGRYDRHLLVPLRHLVSPARDI